MIHSIARRLNFSRVLLLVAAGGLGCTVKGIQSNTHDGGADAGSGRRDGGKSDARGIDAQGGQALGGFGGSNAGASGGKGGSPVAGTTFTTTFFGGSWTAGVQTGGTTSMGGTTSSSSKKPDAGVFDAYRPDAKDAAGGTGGSKQDAHIPDANKADTRDAPLGGTGGSSSSGGVGGSSTRDASVPDAPLPDTALPDTAIDTPVITPDAPPAALHIYGFNVFSGSTSGTQITVSAGKSVTFVWDVSGATTKFIDNDIGMVSGSTETITMPADLETETTYTYKLTVTNAVNDASTGFESATAEVKVTVVPLKIKAFTASETVINAGESVTLTSVFLGTEGTISNNINSDTISVATGDAKVVSPTEPTTYTLTVKNRLNDTVTATVVITMPRPDSGS